MHEFIGMCSKGRTGQEREHVRPCRDTKPKCVPREEWVSWEKMCCPFSWVWSFYLQCMRVLPGDVTVALMIGICDSYVLQSRVLYSIVGKCFRSFPALLSEPGPVSTSLTNVIARVWPPWHLALLIKPLRFACVLEIPLPLFSSKIFI